MNQLFLFCWACTFTGISSAVEMTPVLQNLLTGTATTVSALYADFARQAESLQQNAQNFCRGEHADLENLRSAWRRTASAWDRAEIFLDGPAMEKQRDYHINYWPLNQRQIEALLNDSQALSAEELLNGSVGRKGLAGLEYLLFDSEQAAALGAKTRRCDYLLLASAEIHQHARDIQRAWRSDAPADYRHQFVTASNALSAPMTPSQALGALVSNLVRQAENLRDRKLGEPLGKKTKGIAKPYRLQAWRSRSSREGLLAGLQGLRDLMFGVEAEVYSVADYLRDQRHTELIARIRQQIDQSEKLALESDADWFVLLEKNPSALEPLYQSLSELRRLLRDDLSAALDVNLGFNSADGD